MKLYGDKIAASLMVPVFLVLLGAGFGVSQGTRPAYASANLIYTVNKTTAAGGVFARYGPHTNATNRIIGYGTYPNQQVKLLCGVTDGDQVGPYQNSSWHFVTDLDNPGEGNFWVSDHYLDTPSRNQLA